MGVSAPSEDRIFPDADSDEWRFEVTKAREGVRSSEGVVELMRATPRALAGIGVPQRSWFHTTHHLRLELREPDCGGHGVSAADLERLPDLLGRTPLVWGSEDGGRLCALLSARDSRGDPLVAVIDPDGRARRRGESLECVFLVTVCGRRNLTRMLSAAGSRGDLYLVDADGARDALRETGHVLPDSVARRDGLMRRIRVPHGGGAFGGVLVETCEDATGRAIRPGDVMIRVGSAPPTLVEFVSSRGFCGRAVGCGGEGEGETIVVRDPGSWSHTDLDSFDRA